VRKLDGLAAYHWALGGAGEKGGLRRVFVARLFSQSSRAIEECRA